MSERDDRLTADITTELLLDGLKETMNICMGQAATTLSELFGKQVAIDVPRLTVDLLQLMGALKNGEEALVITMKILGGADGSISLIFTKPDSITICNIIMDGEGEEQTDELDDLKSSLLIEIGNIVLGNFLNAMSEFTETIFLHEVPELYTGDKNDIKNMFILDPEKSGIKKGFLLQSAFEVGSTIVEGFILLLPEKSLLDVLIENIRSMLS